MPLIQVISIAAIVACGLLAFGIRWRTRALNTAVRIEQRLKEAAAIFEHVSQGILVTDAARRIIAVNPAFTEMTGFSAGEALGKDPRLQQSGRQDRAFYRALWHTLEHTGHWQGEIWNRRKNGEIYPVWENINAVRDEGGRIVRYVAVMADITTVKQAEVRMNHLAHHDALTGLPNRLAFAANLERALERAKRHRRRTALLFLDLDRFKVINDTLGHDAGDRLLQITAERISSTVRGEDLAARLGGDEFTVVMEEIAQAEDADALARKLIHAVAQPMTIEGQEVVVSTSIGIGIYPDDADNPTALMRAADTAMYRAKAGGRNTCEFYASGLTERAQERLSLETALRHACAHGELVLHYQPVLDLRTGRISSFEALLRWQHPVHGLLLPERFIGVAKESRLIESIGEWVMRQACAQLAAWRALGIAVPRIAINLSAQELLYGHVDEVLGKAMEEIAAGGGMLLGIEVTESVLAARERVTERLASLRDLGVALVIDGFGQGCASPGLLNELRFEGIKIDRSLMRGIPHDSASCAIVAAIIAMAHALRIRVCAIGVEHEDQLAFLRAHDCDEAQGLLIGAPVEAVHIATLLQQRGAFPGHASMAGSSAQTK